jgi:two-component system, sporulation sensor kinase E
MITNRSYIKAILDNSPESIVLIGKNHEVLAYNKAIKEVLFQYTGRKIKRGDYYYPDFVVEGSKELYLSTFEKAIRGQPIVVHSLTENDSTSIWFEYRMLPVYDEQGELIGVTLSAKNIDAEKKAELKIKSLSETLTAILDNIPEAITLLDKNYRIIALNTVSLNTIKANTKADAQIGDDFRGFIFDDASPFFRQYEAAIKGNYSETEMSYTNSTGGTLWYLSRFNPVYRENGEQIGVSIFAKDITEKKTFELKLAASEDKFKKITSLAPIGIIITDKSLKINFSNYAVQKLFDFSDKELLKMTVADLIKDFDALNDASVTIGEAVVNIDALQFSQERFQGVAKNNHVFDILLSSSSYYSGHDIYYIFLLQDISDLLSKESTISVQHKKLREIAWVQSHIIRSPVARIMGIIRLMEDDNFSFDEGEKNLFYSCIMESAKELDKVISDIVTKTDPY